MMDLSKPSEVTGMRRAFFEMSIAISAQKAMEEMTSALLGHAARSLTYRLILEIATKPGDFSHSGGKLN